MGATFSGDQTAVADIIARGALYDANSMADRHMDAGGGMLSHLANIGVTIGQLKNNIFKEPMDQAKAQDTLPIVQALIIFLVIMFYPMVMIAGNYNFKVVGGLFFLLFSLIFTTFIWHALTALQNTVNDSLSYVNFQNPEEKPLFQNFFTILYYAVPLGFNSLIAGTGVLLGGQLEGLTNALTGTKANSSGNGSSGGGYFGGGGNSGGSSGSGGGEAGAEEAAETAAEVAAAL